MECQVILFLPKCDLTKKNVERIMKRMKFDPICDWNEISFPKTRAIESIKTKSYAKTKLDSFGKLSIGHGKS